MVLLLLLLLFVKAGSLVNKCGCFYLLGLAGSQGTAVLSAVSNCEKKKVQVRREELSLSSQVYERTDAGRHPWIVPLCRSISEPTALLEHEVHKHT